MLTRYAGHGFATEAATAILEDLREPRIHPRPHPHPRILALADSDNAASIRVLTKLGLEPGPRIRYANTDHWVDTFERRSPAGQSRRTDPPQQPG